MRLVSLLAVLFLVSGGAPGCSSSVAKPTLVAPGPVGFQQRVAERYDPYPDNNLGPPIVGGRPREFDAPREPLPLRPADDSPRYAPAPYSKSNAAPTPFMPGGMLPGPAAQ